MILTPQNRREALKEKKKAREKLKKQVSSPLKYNNTNSNVNGTHAEVQRFSMADVDLKIKLMKKGTNNAWGYYSTKEEVRAI